MMKRSKNNKLGMFGSAPSPVHNENRRIIGMCVLAVLLAVAFIFQPRNPVAEPEGPSQPPLAEAPQIKIPELHVEELRAVVKDSTSAQRLILEPEAIKLAFSDASRLAAAHYDVMGIQDAGLKTIEPLVNDPDAARLQPLRLRGFLLKLEERKGPNHQQYHSGSMALDDGTLVHFMVSRIESDKLDLGSSVRIDGLFVKFLRDEVDGAWLDGPLIIGREMQRSFAAVYTGDLTLGENGGTFTEGELAGIINDNVDDGLGSLPFEQKWKLMARAAQLKPGDIDWETVPIFDGDVLTSALTNGKQWNGMPIRLPLRGVAHVTSTSKPAGENPARLSEYTEGWLMEYSWKSEVQAVQYLAPFAVNPPEAADPTAIGRGFFFKNLAFKSSGRGVELTSVLVLSDIVFVESTKSPLLKYILIGVAMATVLMVAGIFFQLRRDHRRSAELQEQRTARRKQRRQAADA